MGKSLYPFDLNMDGKVDGLDFMLFDVFFGDDDELREKRGSKRKMKTRNKRTVSTSSGGQFKEEDNNCGNGRTGRKIPYISWR